MPPTPMQAWLSLELGEMAMGREGGVSTQETKQGALKAVNAAVRKN
jgi:hypothetical protein